MPHERKHLSSTTAFNIAMCVVHLCALLRPTLADSIVITKPPEPAGGRYALNASLGLPDKAAVSPSDPASAKEPSARRDDLSGAPHDLASVIDGSSGTLSEGVNVLPPSALYDNDPYYSDDLEYTAEEGVANNFNVYNSDNNSSVDDIDIIFELGLNSDLGLINSTGNEDDIDGSDAGLGDLNDLLEDLDHYHSTALTSDVTESEAVRVGRAQSDVMYRKWRYKLTNRGRQRGHKSDRNVTSIAKHPNKSRMPITKNLPPVRRHPLREDRDRYQSSQLGDDRRRPGRVRYGNDLTLAERRRIAWRRKQRLLAMEQGGNRHHGGRRPAGGVVATNAIVNHHRRVSVTTKTETVRTRVVPGTVHVYNTSSITRTFPGVTLRPPPPYGGITRSPYHVTRPSPGVTRPPPYGSDVAGSGSRGGQQTSVVTPPSGGVSSGTSFPAWVGGLATTNRTTSTTSTSTKTYYGYYRSLLGFLLSEYENQQWRDLYLFVAFIDLVYMHCSHLGQSLRIGV